MATITTTTVTTLAELKAAPTNNASLVFDASLWTWTLDNYEGQADDLNIVKANSISLSAGAWIRQRATSINFDGRSVNGKIAETRAFTDRTFAGGAKGDGVTDNAVAFAAALEPANAGHKILPAGVFAAGPVNVDLLPGAPHHLDGDGPGVSVLRKRDNNAAILLAMAGTPQNLDNHTVLANLSFDNGFRGANGTGLRLTNTARSMLQNVVFDGLGAGFYARGALLQTNIGVTFRACGKGFSQERGPGFDAGNGSTAYVYPNMNKFYGGTALGCSITGFDINHASGFGLVGVNVEANGTAGDLGTGGMIIRSGIAAETGFGTMEISGHFEKNSGFGGIFGTNLAGLVLHIRDSDFLANEAARDITITGARSVGLTCNQGNGIARIEARMSFVHGGIYNTLNDTSSDFVHHTETADGKRVMWMSQFRLCHDPQAPLNADLQFLRGDEVTGQGSDRNTSYILKRGDATVNFRSGGVNRISFSSFGIGLNGNNPVSPVSIENPTDGPSTQSALVALLNYLRNRGDITPSS